MPSSISERAVVSCSYDATIRQEEKAKLEGTEEEHRAERRKEGFNLVYVANE